MGKVDLSILFVRLNGQRRNTLGEAKAVAAPTPNYGLFLNSIIDFLIVAVGIFLLFRQVNRLTEPKTTPAAPTTRECPF